MGFITTSSLAPVEIQKFEYLYMAACTFQEIDGIMFKTIKDHVYFQDHDRTIAEIKALVKKGKNVCIVSAHDKNCIVLTNIVKE